MAYTTINKSTDYFNTLTYSGNGSNPRTLTGVGFQPDWVWLKNRTDGNGHTLADAVRGANKTISSDGTDAEITDKSDGHLDAFTSDGFTVGAGSSSDARVNDGSHTYVAWNWKANGAGSANTDGDINSTVSVNTTAGFSIVKYTGTGATATIGHGLGVAPKMIIIKQTNTTRNWVVGHDGIGWTKYLYLDSTNAQGTGNLFNDTAPTNQVFSVVNDGGVNASGGTYIAYCFAEKKGFSKFGSYTGNGSTDGTFIYTGFKPAFILSKKTNASGTHWTIWDNKRSSSGGGNAINKILHPNNSNPDNTADDTDFLSNGFKLRATASGMNNSGDTYIYMAFGQSLVGSNNIPCTAR